MIWFGRSDPIDEYLDLLKSSYIYTHYINNKQSKSLSKG